MNIKTYGRPPIVMTSSRDRRTHVRQYKLTQAAIANGITMKPGQIYNAAIIIAARSVDTAECKTLLECTGLI